MTRFAPADLGIEGLTVRTCAIDGLLLLTPKRIGDHRGFFSESFKATWFEALGIDAAFVQDNHSMSRARGVLRGLHFQAPPAAQGKLIRVLAGAIHDVAVDIRRGSPTYGRHAAVVLNASDGDQFWVPPGFAHGFVTLADNTEVLYKVTAPYAPASERGVAWNDPELAIAWPIAAEGVTLSARDMEWPVLRAVDSPFMWSTLDAAGPRSAA
jgi:dTDP-4-dehydrorhamnose 3,5-epimerase